MITGNLKITDHDDFETEINDMIGSVEENQGLEFYFYCLRETFKISEKALYKYRDDYEADLKAEKESDPEIWRSMVTGNPMHGFSMAPPLPILYQSYFITILSELELKWREIIDLYNRFRLPASETPLDNAEAKINQHTLRNLPAGSLLHTVVMSHSILTTYNYIRNKIVHQSWKPGPDFEDLKSKIQSGKITNFSLDTTSATISGKITDMKFVENYENQIIAFLKDIVTISYTARKASADAKP